MGAPSFPEICEKKCEKFAILMVVSSRILSHNFLILLVSPPGFEPGAY